MNVQFLDGTAALHRSLCISRLTRFLRSTVVVLAGCQ